jgi:formate hydrogenlyase subunit 3/multisubunit Na+/H+ antiporter MnhD subunit
MATLGKSLAVLGLILVVLGLLLWAGNRIPLLNRLGRLPGDIYVRRDNFTFYFPLTTAIVISVVISLLLRLMKR